MKIDSGHALRSVARCLNRSRVRQNTIEQYTRVGVTGVPFVERVLPDQILSPPTNAASTSS